MIPRSIYLAFFLATVLVLALFLAVLFSPVPAGAASLTRCKAGAVMTIGPRQYAQCRSNRWYAISEKVYRESVRTR